MIHPDSPLSILHPLALRNRPQTGGRRVRALTPPRGVQLSHAVSRIAQAGGGPHCLPDLDGIHVYHGVCISVPLPQGEADRTGARPVDSLQPAGRAPSDYRPRWPGKHESERHDIHKHALYILLSIALTHSLSFSCVSSSRFLSPPRPALLLLSLCCLSSVFRSYHLFLSVSFVTSPIHVVRLFG